MRQRNLPRSTHPAPIWIEGAIIPAGRPSLPLIWLPKDNAITVVRPVIEGLGNLEPRRCQFLNQDLLRNAVPSTIGGYAFDRIALGQPFPWWKVDNHQFAARS